MSEEDRTVDDVYDDRVLTAFLLGTLDEQTRERIFDRLGTEDAFFERIAALEDDLLLRWHRGQLLASEREQFMRSYAEPARWARVEDAGKLVDAANAWKITEGVDAPPRQMAAPGTVSSSGAIARALAWIREPLRVPRLAMGGAIVVLVASLAGYVVARRAAEEARPLTVSVTLTAVGQKGTDPAAKGYDDVRLPSGATTVAFVVAPQTVPVGGRVTAELVARDRPTVLELGSPTVDRATAQPRLIFTVPTSNLPDGDYVLTVRHEGDGETASIATQAFRVTRS